MGSRATSRARKTVTISSARSRTSAVFPDLQVRDRQVEGGERGVEGVVLVDERLADLGQEVTGSIVISQAGGDAAFDPIQAATVLLAAMGRGQGFQIGQKSLGLLVAVGLGETVRQVVTEAEQEAGLPVGIDEAVRFLQGLDGGSGVAHLDERRPLATRLLPAR